MVFKQTWNWWKPETHMTRVLPKYRDWYGKKNGITINVSTHVITIKVPTLKRRWVVVFKPKGTEKRSHMARCILESELTRVALKENTMSNWVIYDVPKDILDKWKEYPLSSFSIAQGSLHASLVNDWQAIGAGSERWWWRWVKWMTTDESYNPLRVLKLLRGWRSKVTEASPIKWSRDWRSLDKDKGECNRWRDLVDQIWICSSPNQGSKIDEQTRMHEHTKLA